MKLLVRNLSRTSTENEIRRIFASFGAVSECDLVLDTKTGESKGFAFVEMSNEVEAKAAQKKLHMSPIAGSKVRVKIAEA